MPVTTTLPSVVIAIGVDTCAYPFWIAFSNFSSPLAAEVVDSSAIAELTVPSNKAVAKSVENFIGLYYILIVYKCLVK